MNTNGQPTCGKGLAENSVLPAKLGELMAAMAENLRAHMQALDPTDENSRAEHAAYERLVNQLQQAADQLRTTALQMAGYHDLPMGRHDHKEMTHPRVYNAFEKFVKQKQDLLKLLEQTAERDSQLLDVMREHGR